MSILESTFFHIPGFGVALERKLWAQGCLSWNTFLENPKEFDIHGASHDLAIKTLYESIKAYEERNHAYFERILGIMQAWRAWPTFRDESVYLDIETDGMGPTSKTTTIGLYDGHEFTCLVQRQTLKDFPEIMKKYKMIITFYGTGFDLPFLKKEFPSIQFGQIHLDLCPVLKNLGYKGGLKKIEKQLGINRGEETEGLTGYHAVKLWQAYQRGDISALDRLIEYNKEDVVNLETLAEIAYKQHLATLPKSIQELLLSSRK